MSGGIKLPDGTFWGAAGWAYRTALNEICQALRDEVGDVPLYERLSDDYGEARTIEFIDTSSWPPSERDSFFRAIHLAFNTTRERGPIDWSSPEAFPDFIALFGRLVTQVDELKASLPPSERDPV